MPDSPRIHSSSLKLSVIHSHSPFASICRTAGVDAKGTPLDALYVSRSESLVNSALTCRPRPMAAPISVCFILFAGEGSLMLRR